MLASKIVVVFLLCFVHGCIGKPVTEDEVIEGRGIMTSIWEWIKYPFSYLWWSSEESGQPAAQPLIAAATSDPTNIIDIGSHKVSVSCNDQTCTTVKCNKTQCRNITCSIYDTNFRGECREYNILNVSEEPLAAKSTEPTKKETSTSVVSKPTEILIITSTESYTTEGKGNNLKTEEHPLELEKLISLTVNDKKSDEIKKYSEDIKEIENAGTQEGLIIYNE
ncbi:hypothetical protein B5X24_HaOG212666 [Helicoverpa armigera]|nr:hypothetical protein B5X24_HaOG212666 [Helicoverpa armigera]